MNTGIDSNTITDTKNTAGATQNDFKILYPIGVLDQDDYSQSYINDGVYIENDTTLNVQSMFLNDGGEV